jgi:hypothetical protein
LQKFHPIILNEIDVAVHLGDAAAPHTWAFVVQGLGFADALEGIAPHRSHQLQQAAGCWVISINDEL